MGRLFGTDGARGVANTELTPELAMKIGRAAAMVLIEENENKHPKVLIGADTRLSGDMLESALAAGLCSVGADVLTLGVIPTPAVAYLVKHYGYDAGIMISASHNPFEYNGIKIFKRDGFKLPDAVEEEIEAIILDEVRIPPVKVGAEVGRITHYAETAHRDYINHLLATTEYRFNEMRVAIDCANGAASTTAKKLFEYLGCTTLVLAAEPDGLNINDNCGSTHVENLQKFVRENECTVGFAFDGDADRLIAVDEHGDVVDGDKIIAICAKDMKEKGTLQSDTVVVTVMSNMGFFKFAEEEGIHCEKTKVGDRYVLENMLENGYTIGGEQSGHVIFLDYATTGDGELSAIQVLKAMKRSGKSLSQLASCMEVYPQVLINVKVSNIGKVRLPEDKEVWHAVEEAEKELGDTGRVLVRVSGTEPLVRVMLEGKDTEQIERLGNEIAEVVRERLI
ncbi:MAG: phosphoglucosamine mutase [Clostridia bacterium]|nr:phosphoglucosamine mutase [Clostridia bacterium]MBO7690545.1 phosphoglucosamine mutase [Clostridia bacterium]MBP5272573.1 phosphoglucosamine mutase [Clostridia bacterium]